MQLQPQQLLLVANLMADLGRISGQSLPATSQVITHYPDSIRGKFGDLQDVISPLFEDLNDKKPFGPKLWNFFTMLQYVLTMLLNFQVDLDDVNRLPNLQRDLDELVSLAHDLRDNIHDPKFAQIVLDRMKELIDLTVIILQDGVKESLRRNKSKHIDLVIQKMEQGGILTAAMGGTYALATAYTAKSCTAMAVFKGVAISASVGGVAGLAVFGILHGIHGYISHEELKSEVLFRAKTQAKTLANELGRAVLMAEKVMRECNGVEREAIRKSISNLDDIRFQLKNFDPEKD